MVVTLTQLVRSQLVWRASLGHRLMRLILLESLQSRFNMTYFCSLNGVKNIAYKQC